MSRDISDRWPDADDAAAIGGPVTDGGTPRNKIAERVASAVAETAREELARRADDRLDDDGIDEVVSSIQYRTEESVNGRLKLESAEKHGHDIVTDGSGATQAYHAIPIHIDRDGKRVAAGALLPSGAVAVEWNREAFPEGERTEHPTTSLYGHVEDAEQASGGKVIITDSEEPTFYCDNCGTELTVLYDDREDLSTPIVCGHCGENNTRLLKPMTDGVPGGGPDE